MIALPNGRHAQIAILVACITSLVPSHAQGVFDIPPDKLSVEQAKTSSSQWTMKERKLGALLNTDIESYYYPGVAKSEERRQELEAELSTKKDDLLHTAFYWRIPAPALHLHDEDISTGLTRFGFAVEPPIAFPQAPIRTITLGSPLLTADVRYIDLPTENREPLMDAWEDHHFLWIFQVADDAADLHTRQLRLLIFNKYSEEVVHDQVFR